MTRTINLKDYNDIQTTFEIEDFEHVVCIILYVITGDECIYIVYDDRDNKWFNSCDSRITNYFDGSVVLYVRNEFDNIAS